MYYNKIFTQEYKYDRMRQNKTIEAAYDRCSANAALFPQTMSQMLHLTY